MTGKPPQPEPLHAIERAWMRDRAQSTERLDENIHTVFQYALRLACTKSVVTANGEEICFDDLLNPYRQKLMQLMHSSANHPWVFSDDAWHGVGTLAWHGDWKKKDILDVLPSIQACLVQALSCIKERFPQLSDAEFEHALAQKKLVLALGGGGGTGFAHLSLFQYLEECGITPSLITGTSIGALLGYLRAMQTRYDAARTILRLPGFWDFTKCIRPCIGAGRHGLMALCRIDISSIIESIAKSFGWSTAPSLNELKIPFACVSSGILSNTSIVRTLEQQSRNPLQAIFQLTRLTWHHAMQHAAQIAELLATPNAVTPVVFGVDAMTRDMPGSDAISFSMLVPGVFSYELPTFHYKSREILNQMFKARGLYRLTDGGLASNVPVRAACSAIREHRLGQGTGNQNVYILGMDVFAPQPSDGLFYPLQKIANENAVIDAGYADAFVRLKYLLSPMNLIPSLAKLRWLNDKFKKTFAPEMRVIQYALKPLLPLQAVLTTDHT